MTPRTSTPCPCCGAACIEWTNLSESYTRWHCSNSSCGMSGERAIGRRNVLLEQAFAGLGPLVPIQSEPLLESALLTPGVSKYAPGGFAAKLKAARELLAETRAENQRHTLGLLRCIERMTATLPEPPNNTPPGLLKVSPFPSTARMGTA